MKFNTQYHSHLTYCSNIHPGESWQDHFEQLKNSLPAVKKSISPDEPFGVGLRLSAMAAKTLVKPDELARFKKWMDEQKLYLFTINGFPYGSFHGERVKDNVYKPDWSEKKRFDYTLNLIEILHRLLPDGVEGGISTSPVSYKYWHDSRMETGVMMQRSVKHLAKTAYRMAEIEEEEKKYLHLDIEPEPDCILENSIETVSFFKQWLLPEGGRVLQKEYNLTPGRAKEILLRHLKVCYDTCHFAVEYEDPEVAIGRLLAEGIGIGKTQISSALKVQLGEDASKRIKLSERLAEFDEPTYLHQVVEMRNDDTYRQYRDLNQALENVDDPAAVEWRIHFHVPIFLDHFDDFDSTQDHILQSLPILLNNTDCRHFEVETYTWDVLPGSLKTDLVESIVRELKWVQKRD